MTSPATTHPGGIAYPDFPNIGIDPNSPEISDDIFEKIEAENIKESEECFGNLVRCEFDNLVNYASVSPKYNATLLCDAYQSYRWDAQRLDDNMPDSPTPDHFKLSGYLAYWLRRNSPVTKFEPTEEEHRLTTEAKQLRQFLFEYGRVYLPFMMGYRICWFFERNKEGGKRLPDFIDADYINTACYFLKYKNVSPHSLGLVYRSLFFV